MSHDSPNANYIPMTFQNPRGYKVRPCSYVCIYISCFLIHEYYGYILHQPKGSRSYLHQLSYHKSALNPHEMLIFLG